MPFFIALCILIQTVIFGFYAGISWMVYAHYGLWASYGTMLTCLVFQLIICTGVMLACMPRKTN